MELILNTNHLGYEQVLDTDIDAIIVGLKNFCVGETFPLPIKKLSTAINNIKNKKKKIYLSLNLFATEKDIKRIKKTLKKIINLNIDGYIVSDLGIINIFKTLHLESKVILDLQTYVTNKYSASSLLNLGVKRIYLAKEITLEDIKEISKTNDNIELLAQGYYPITYSKRPILTCYFKNFKTRRKSSLYFIKEESREDFYPLVENKNCLLVYNNKQYSLFNNLPELINEGIKHLRIDTAFLEKKEIEEYIEFYSKAIKLIKEGKIDMFTKLKEEFNNKYVFDTPFLYNESFLLKEGK